MMTLVCIKPFGHRKPGDEVTVPDGSVFDTEYFMLKPEAAPKAKPGKENK
jgi:hypothetical protein